jgi:hypothetical protein
MSKKYETVRATSIFDLPKQLTQAAQGKDEFKVIEVIPAAGGKYTAIVEYKE